MPNRLSRALETRAPLDGEYPPGLYTLAAESFSTNHWDQLGVESQRRGFGPGAKHVWQLPCMPENAMRASRPRVARMGTHGDRIQPELALGINGSHGGWAVACRRSLVKALKFLRSALKTG